MGRDAGFLALNGAIASGAEAAIIPEFSTEVGQLEEFIKKRFPEIQEQQYRTGSRE